MFIKKIIKTPLRNHAIVYGFTSLRVMPYVYDWNVDSEEAYPGESTAMFNKTIWLIDSPNFPLYLTRE